MSKRSIIRYVVFLIFALAIIGIWGYREQQQSYKEPSQAIQASEEGLLLIPAYKRDDKSLYFFIKDRNNLGSTYAHKGMFGWKSDFFTWGSMDPNRNYEQLWGFQVHGENLVYGLIRLGTEQTVMVDNQEAQLLNLAMLPPSVVEDYQLEGLFLWYFEKEDQSEYKQVKLLQRDTQEIIQTIDL
ncbi:hypothetical protein [Bacillus sp. SG-1]|uniref:hypothetical protein n=1 Tax=Bacillus sp. SG-1 TaxID=161544 RepID=UPI0005C6AC3E|nr:hypothetical protein [Bacillus sp. SG-1]